MGHEEAILHWVQRYSSKHQPNQLSDLSTGLCFLEILTELAPEYFEKLQLEAASDNQEVHYTNLRMLRRNLCKYFSQELSVSDDFEDIDVRAIAMDHNQEHILAFCHLLIGIAVLGEKRNEYVMGIIKMADADQKIMQHVIKRVIEKYGMSIDDDDDDDDNESRAEDLARLEQLEGENKALKAELQEVNRMAQERKEELLKKATELEETQEKLIEVERELSLSQLDRENTAKSIMKQSSVDAERLNHLMSKIGEMEQEVSDKDVLIEKLNKKADENVELNKQLATLRDQMDDLEAAAEEAKRLKAKSAKLDAKVEALKELKDQVKYLTNQNNTLTKENIMVRSELDQVPLLKTRLENLQAQNEKLTQLVAAKSEKAVGGSEVVSGELVAEVERMRSQVMELQIEKQALESQVVQLNDDLNLKELELAGVRKEHTGESPMVQHEIENIKSLLMQQAAKEEAKAKEKEVVREEVEVVSKEEPTDFKWKEEVYKWLSHSGDERWEKTVPMSRFTKLYKRYLIH